MSKFNNFYRSVLGEQSLNYGDIPGMVSSDARLYGTPLPSVEKTGSMSQTVPGIPAAKQPAKAAASSAPRAAKRKAPYSANKPNAPQAQEMSAINDIFAIRDAVKMGKWNEVKDILTKYEGQTPEGFVPGPNTQQVANRFRRAQPVDQQAINREMAARGYQAAPAGTRVEGNSVRRKSGLGGVAGSLSNFLGDVGNTLRRR